MKKFLIIAVLFIGCDAKDSAEYKELVVKCQANNNLLVSTNADLITFKNKVVNLEKKNSDLLSEQETLRGEIAKLEARIKHGTGAYGKLLERSKAQDVLIKADDDMIKEYKKLIEDYDNIKISDVVNQYDNKIKEVGRAEFDRAMRKSDGHKFIWSHTLPFVKRPKLTSIDNQLLEKEFESAFAVENEQLIRPAYCDAKKTGYSVTYKLGNFVEVFYIELE